MNCTEPSTKATNRPPGCAACSGLFRPSISPQPGAGSPPPEHFLQMRLVTHRRDVEDHGGAVHEARSGGGDRRRGPRLIGNLRNAHSCPSTTHPMISSGIGSRSARPFQPGSPWYLVEIVRFDITQPVRLFADDHRVGRAVRAALHSDMLGDRQHTAVRHRPRQQHVCTDGERRTGAILVSSRRRCGMPDRFGFGYNSRVGCRLE